MATTSPSTDHDDTHASVTEETQVGRGAVFMPLTPHDPQRISGYLLRARIGQGGMGAVYLSHTPGGRAVALKVAREEFAHDPAFRSRFAKEVAIAKRVQGPYTVPVVDCDADADAPWMATVYVAAPSLAAAVAHGGTLPAESVLILIAGIAEALQAIHRAGVVHRDLKPGNVILAPDGPRVIDFGVARAVEASTAALTQAGMRIGTPAFMAPEQVQGKPPDPAGDVFALGATAYYAATGRPPFGADAAVFHRIENLDPDWTDCPDQIRDVLARCLDKNPARRPTPAQLIELCRSASAGDHLRADDIHRPGPDWLPPTLTDEITRYSLASLPPLPPPEVPAVPALSTLTGVSGAVTVAAPVPPPGLASADGPAVPVEPARPAAPRRRGRGRKRWVLLGLGAVALSLVTALAAFAAVAAPAGDLRFASEVLPPSAGPQAEPAAIPTAPAPLLGGFLDTPGPADSPGMTHAAPARPGRPASGARLPTTAAKTDRPRPKPVPTSRPPTPRPSAPAPKPAATPTPTPTPTGCPSSPRHGYNGDGTGVATVASALRSGPAEACGTVATVAKGTKVWLWCSTVNSYNHLWWWARLDGTTTYGWIWDGDLKISYGDDDGDGDGKARIYSCNGTFVDR